MDMDMSHYYHQEENRFRGAAHAGSWYTSNGKTISLMQSEREKGGGDYSQLKKSNINFSHNSTAAHRGFNRLAKTCFPETPWTTIPSYRVQGHHRSVCRI